MVPVRPSDEIERRIYDALESAAARGTALTTRLLAKRAFHPGTSRTEIVATRQALRSLECKGFARRIVRGIMPGESIWTHAPVFVSEGDDGRRAYFTVRPHPDTKKHELGSWGPPGGRTYFQGEMAMRFGGIKHRLTEPPLEADFTAKTIQEAEALANRWVLANVPHDWGHEFVRSAQTIAHAPAPGQKPALDEYMVTVKLSPGRDADPNSIARVREAIAKHRSAHS